MTTSAARGAVGDERPAGTERWRCIYHCRDVEDENVIISFGFF
jgi:hypothetical protein